MKGGGGQRALRGGTRTYLQTKMKTFHQLLSWRKKNNEQHFTNFCLSRIIERWGRVFPLHPVLRKKVKSDTRTSNVVSHHRTNLARHCLTSQIGRDGVLSM